MAGWHEDFMDCPEPEELGYDDDSWNNRDESDPNDPYYDPYWGDEEMAEVDWDCYYNDFPDYSDW